jgi:hypothetical protein
MFEVICIGLLVLYVLSVRYIILLIGIIVGDKEVCNEFVNNCVPLKEQWKVQFREPPQDIVSDKAHRTKTWPSLPESPPQN